MRTRIRRGTSGAVYFYSALACACFWGCSGHKNPSPSVAPPQQAVAQSARTYALGREPDQERERAFQALLVAAHSEALDRHGAAPETGLSYSLSPKGTVYPFSEVEVVCLVQKADFSQGRAFCEEFFKAVDAGFGRVTTPR